MAVGIFWYIDNAIVGFKSDISILRMNSIGVIDSDFEHVKDWSKISVSSVDYDYFPRGRVVFDTNIKKHIVYLDEKLNTLLVKGKICDFFDVRLGEKIIFEKDVGYVS